MTGWASFNFGRFVISTSFPLIFLQIPLGKTFKGLLFGCYIHLTKATC